MELEYVIRMINLLKKEYYWNGYRFVSIDGTVTIPMTEMNRILGELKQYGLHPPEFSFI